MALGYLAAGVIQCITIVGIPFGIQSFKLAGFALWPFGRVVVQRTDRDQALSCLGNVVWFVPLATGGWAGSLPTAVEIPAQITELAQSADYEHQGLSRDNPIRPGRRSSPGSPATDRKDRP
jgi:uncharacterized membrane protein YccF (DUF307 family)